MAGAGDLDAQWHDALAGLTGLALTWLAIELDGLHLMIRAVPDAEAAGDAAG
jgi:hypothetical protein